MQYNNNLKNQSQDPVRKLCPESIRKDLKNMITSGLLERFSKRLNKDEEINVEGFTGFESAYLIVYLGNETKMHVFEFFTKDKRGDELDGALGILVDYADGALEEFFRYKRNRFFPIDFIQKEYDKHPIWAKHELRNLKAEAERDVLLKKDKLGGFFDK